ncbi:MAG: metalloregulator ArsR/SmtB family transcription factor [Candidatus Omnitrophica bacterium]|nr:metalloregulator ArsR/SmtB family transcription factor [Candidatus Omnitrophota bacterium]
MDKREKELYRKKGEILKAISHPIRLAIIDLLKNSEKSVAEIVNIIGSSQSNISKHLSILKKVGIVDDKKEGLNRIYYLRLPCVINFSLCVAETLRKKIELDRKLLLK